MCKPNSEIHFCTCAAIPKETFPLEGNEEVRKTDYEKTHFIWTLFRYLGKKKSHIHTLGTMIMPVESLGSALNSEYLINEINSKNCFDFSYTPSEGDNLQIREEYIYKSIKGKLRPDLYDYMSFIFRKGNWKEKVYDVFSDKTRKFKTGTIEIHSSDKNS